MAENGAYRCHCGAHVEAPIATISHHIHGDYISEVWGACPAHGRVEVYMTSEVRPEDFCAAEAWKRGACQPLSPSRVRRQGES